MRIEDKSDHEFITLETFARVQALTHASLKSDAQEKRERFEKLAAFKDVDSVL